MLGITLTNVTFTYGENVVLSGLSLTVEPGDFTAVVGPNGSGKSTMLKIIAGLLPPDKGQVTIAGKVRKRLAWQVKSAIFRRTMPRMRRDFRRLSRKSCR